MKKQESLIAYSPNTISALWYNQNKFTQFTIATEYARLLLPEWISILGGKSRLQLTVMISCPQ